MSSFVRQIFSLMTRKLHGNRIQAWHFLIDTKPSHALPGTAVLQSGFVSSVPLACNIGRVIHHVYRRSDVQIMPTLVNGWSLIIEKKISFATVRRTSICRPSKSRSVDYMGLHPKFETVDVVLLDDSNPDAFAFVMRALREFTSFHEPKAVSKSSL